MELKVGMYVRNKRGEIFKFIKVDERGIYRRTWGSDNKNITVGFEIEDVKGEPSYNIIDLIEVGDYVNGYLVYEIIEYEDNTRAIVIGDDNKSIIWEESSQYIKSIVTKEQFESMSYKVGE